MQTFLTWLRRLTTKPVNPLASMSDHALLKHINLDADDGRFNTEYSREYDRRRPARNQGRNTA